MVLANNFQFSQRSLQDFVDCPRRFQLKYIARLAWPALEAEPALENENHLRQGAAFHQLVQQYLLGVPVEKLTPLADQDANLICWWGNFLTFQENLEGVASKPDFNRFPEISFTAPIEDFRLVGKYDLLAISADKFIIYDWKTSRKQPRREWIAANLQTRLYPYLLVKAGAYLNKQTPLDPSQIEMVYWFANFPTAPLKFHYNNLQYGEDQNYIYSLIEEIMTLNESPAPLTDNDKRCHFCVYRSLCNRGVEAGSIDDGSFHELEDDDAKGEFDFDLAFEQVAEIEF